jgi:GNAT superfamily N-acetyltransferase
MKEAHQRVIDDFWEKEMNVGPGWDEAEERVRMVEQGLYSGVQFCLRNGRLVVAAPSRHVEWVSKRLGGKSVEELFSVVTVRRLLAPEVRGVLGPAQVKYADATTFQFAPHEACRMLAVGDEEEHRALVESLSAEERAQIGYEGKGGLAFGAFENGELRAAASYEIWNGTIAHLMVATHPDARGRGFGRAVLSELAEHALALGLVLQYRALAVNERSLRLARALGFEDGVETIYARMG